MKNEKIIIKKVKSGEYEWYFALDTVEINGNQQTIKVEPSLEKILDILQREFDVNQYTFELS
jgi:hypothetical protein